MNKMKNIFKLLNFQHNNYNIKIVHNTDSGVGHLFFTSFAHLITTEFYNIILVLKIMISHCIRYNIQNKT